MSSSSFTAHPMLKSSSQNEALSKALLLPSNHTCHPPERTTEWILLKQCWLLMQSDSTNNVKLWGSHLFVNGRPHGLVVESKYLMYPLLPDHITPVLNTLTSKNKALTSTDANTGPSSRQTPAQSLTFDNSNWLYDSIPISLWNSQSIVNKISSFQTLVYSSSFQIIAITETWLSDYILKNELLPSNFNIVRIDRATRGGGVIVAIHDSVPFCVVSSPSNLKILTVKIDLKTLITLCVVYLPPLSTPSYHSDLLSYFDQLLTPNKKTVILADFNFPDISWETLSENPPQSYSFCDLVYKFNLTQSVSHLTHIKGNIVHIVLINDPDLIQNLTVDSSNSLPPTSDHFKISFSSSISTPPMAKSETSYIFNYSKADWPGLSYFLLDYNFTSMYILHL